MRDDFDRKWELIQMLLDADMQGKPVRPAASRRTLFGIKSTAEQVMDSVAEEMEERAAAKRAARQTGADGDGPTPS